ncbi:MAG: hypothetical protein ACQEXC_15230 [Pseudomonadota bacterium]
MKSISSCCSIVFLFFILAGCGYDLPEITKANCLDSEVGQDVHKNASPEQKKRFEEECFNIARGE